MASNSRTSGYGGASPVLKAASVRLRHTDPYSIPVDDRLAQANHDGYLQGYEEGFTAGATEAGAALIEIGEQLRDRVLGALAEQSVSLQAARAADADRVVSVALEVARWVVRRELASVPDAFFGRLAEVLADRNRDVRTEIFTAPVLVEPTRVWLDDPSVLVLAAADLQPGEARVTIGDTTIFAGFEQAFERARLLLRQLDDAVVTPADGAAEGADGYVHGTDGCVEDESVEVVYDAIRDGAW